MQFANYVATDWSIIRRDMWKNFFPINCILFAVLIYSTSSIGKDQDINAIQAEKQYFDSLFTSSEAQFQQEFEFPFVLMLNDSQKQIYDAIDSLSARKLFIQLYWQRENPNPILPENKLLMDFITRWNYVKVNFSTSSSPFFDDRGTYYMRYGKPTNWYKDSGGRKTVRFFQDRGVYNYISNIYSGLPPSTYYTVHPNESWIYRDIGQDFVIHFIKEGTQYHEAASLSKALDTGILKNVAWYWNDMIQSRAHLSPAFARAANNALQIENDILSAAFMGPAGPLRKDNRLPHQQILEQKSILESDIIKSKSDVPLYVFYEGRSKDSLSFSTDIAQFLGTNDSTQIEIVFLAHVQNNIFPKGIDSVFESVNIQFQSFIRDSTFKSTVNIEDTVGYSTQFLNHLKYDNLVFNHTVQLAAQTGDLTMQIKDLDSGKMGYTKKDLTVRNFTGTDLMISDIQLLTEVSEKAGFDFVPTIEKQNVRVMPYPYPKIHKSIPAFCYFEIYNIQKSGIEDEFEIELAVFSKKERGGIFKKFFKWITGAKDAFISIVQNRSVIDDDMKELVAMDFSQLDRGKYFLEITINFKANNKKISASTRKQITISDK